jgi:multicomponent Na+:H+ antiporter subunit B
MRLDVILRVIAKLLLPFTVVFGFYVHFHAETSPGGGFQAGVVIGAGVILYAIIFGLDEAIKIVPVRAVELLVSVGTLIFLGVGIVGWLLGGNYLDYYALPIADPIISQEVGIHLVEIGVLMAVTGAVIAIFYAFAGRGRSR